MAVELVIQQDQQVQVLSTEATALERQADALQVVDNATLTGATDMLGRIAGLKKAIEARRTALVKPLNDHVKSINAWLKGVAAPVEAADQTVRSKVLAYQQEQERIRRAEEERLRKLAERSKPGWSARPRRRARRHPLRCPCRRWRGPQKPCRPPAAAPRCARSGTSRSRTSRRCRVST